MSTDWQSKLSPAIAPKVARCQEILQSMGRVVISFSGGVDSTLLLALAVDALPTDHVLAATGLSPSLPRRELDDARSLAKQLKADLVEIPTGEMNDPRYTANPAQRCYYCKMDLFGRMRSVAKARGFDAIVTGANADDTGDFRPGLQAGREAGVRTPLMEAGLTKAEIREISRCLGLPTADKPAMACLASRIPYGQPITMDNLRRIEQAEEFLKGLGLEQCRVRAHDALARIEIPPNRFEAFLTGKASVVERFKTLGFTYVTLDMQGLRTGSMNEVLPSQTRAAGSQKSIKGADLGG